MPFSVFLRDFHVETLRQQVYNETVLFMRSMSNHLQKFRKINPVIVVRIERFKYKITIFIRFPFGIEFLRKIEQENV